MLSRRETLMRAITATLGAAALAGTPLGAMLSGEAEAQIRERPEAQPWTTPFGVALRDGAFTAEADYRAAVVANARQIVSEAGMKWAEIRPTREQFVFDIPDRHIAFAEANRFDYRGHTLVWYGAMPEWTRALASPAEAEREMVGHIERVMGRYRGRIRSWDVVNEPIADDPAHSRDIRPSIWQARLGEGYIATALRAAARVDPQARLVINDYDIEFVGARFRRKREALLRLVRELKMRNAPLHAVGIQAHLRGELAIDKEGVSAFVREVAAMGLDVLVTELDVIDNLLPGPIELRDAIAAARAYDLLDAIHAVVRPTAVLTWGVTDKHTWVPIFFRRGDGLPNRPLPLDDAYRPKPLMRVIEHFGRRPS